MKDRRLIVIKEQLDLGVPQIEAIFYAITQITDKNSHERWLAETGWGLVSELEQAIRAALEKEVAL